MFEKLFGSRKPKPPLRDIEALTASFAVPAVHLVAQEAASASHFGGTPKVPPGFAWPHRAGRTLSFLARLELPDVQRAARIDWLPPDGTLLFFYDVENQPWGFDPKDRDGWAVVHLRAGEPQQTIENPAPVVLPHRHLACRRIASLLPSGRDPLESLDLSDAESDAYSELQDRAFDGRPQHQLGGFPAPVQGDEMELECQLASHGVYCGDASGYSGPRADALRPGAAEWRLLLQFDSDDDLEVMWGDLGKLYFWIPESAARKADFTATWLVLQCT